MIKISVPNSMTGDMYMHDHEAGDETGIANHELFIVDFFMKNVKEDSNFMDIGGYEGYYTILLGKKIKKGTIYTFEPCVGSYEIIKKNIEIHGLDNVRLYHAAVSNKKSNIILDWRPGAQCVSRTYNFPPGVDNNTLYFENVPSVCLDDFDDKIDLIKIDIEGGEVELFQGAKKFFSRNKDCKVVLELHCCNIRNRGDINLDAFVKSIGEMFDFYNFGMTKIDMKEVRECLNTHGGAAHYILIPR